MNQPLVAGKLIKIQYPLRKLITYCNEFGYSLDYILGISEKNEKYEVLNEIDMQKIGKN